MRFRCLGLGEILWDVLPAGRQLGGAPANFAYHAAALGAEGRVVSRIGRDEPGRAILARLEELGLPTDTLELDDAAPTSTVTVALGTDGHPHYTIHENVAWDRLAAEPAARASVAASDAVCFGSLAQRSEPAGASIRTLLDLARADALRVFDLNLRQHYYSRAVIEQSLALASVLKVNETELPVLTEMFALPRDERAAMTTLAQRFGLRAVVFTRGARGSVVFADGAWAEHPGRRVELADTIGAGDSFTAAFTLGLLHGWPLATIVDRATAVAAFVCTQPGATPSLPAELAAPFRG
ncbi:MAG: carbohydrate kinase [Verrucomicrobia bacterium]|nr:carbohydrate kinase [Verrucomicrobiota bacterium]